MRKVYHAFNLARERNKAPAGSALAWTLIIIMISVIFLAGTQAISLSYARSAFQNTIKDQLRLTAKSSAIVIARSIESENPVLLEAVNDLPTGGSILLDPIQLNNIPPNISPGQSSALITRIDLHTLRITSYSMASGEKETFDVHLKAVDSEYPSGSGITVPDAITWEIDYFGGDDYAAP